MTENPEFSGEESRKASTAPGLEGEGGQYVDADYGDAGSVERSSENFADAGYPDGEYPEDGSGEVRTEDDPADPDAGR